MSLFRAGKAIFRSIVRSVEVFKQGQNKASQVPWQISDTKAIVQYGNIKPDQLLQPTRPAYFLSSFTRPAFQSFAKHARSNMATTYESFLKGHRVFRLIRRGEIHGPLFAFLGFVCTDIGAKSNLDKEEEKDFQKLYQWMQTGIQSSQNEAILSESSGEEHQSLKLVDYDIKERLGEQSCNSAVYAATRNGQQLAVKMLFNFNTNSNSCDLRKVFSREQQVLSVHPNQDEECQYTNISPHHNILPVLHSFVDDVPCFPDAKNSYPAALPPKYTENGFGRNKTMFMVMPRLDCTLQEYLTTHSLNPKTSTLLLLQLLDGITHLTTNRVAHRDLKTDNLLLDTSKAGCPRLVMCDFGCCLAESRLGLQMPFLTEQTDRGGNAMLMAPEVITAECRDGAVIDYTKSDAWAAGAIAYELFGQRNPFCYGGLDSPSYRDEDLPELIRARGTVRWVVKNLLRRDQHHRLSARDASTILHVYLFAPSWWLRDKFLVMQGDILRWLLQSSAETLKERTGRVNDANVKTLLKVSFLSRTSVQEVVNAVAVLRALRTNQISYRLR